jgi:hypothetical protein
MNNPYKGWIYKSCMNRTCDKEVAVYHPMDAKRCGKCHNKLIEDLEVYKNE